MQPVLTHTQPLLSLLHCELLAVDAVSYLCLFPVLLHSLKIISYDLKSKACQMFWGWDGGWLESPNS